jgi:hypothetical protein
MKRSTLVSSLAVCFCLGLSALALAAETPQADAVYNPSASEKNDSATKPMPMADVPVWRQRQIAAAQPVTSKNTPFRPDELLGTEVRSPQNEALGSIENLVMSPATDKVAYLVIALDRSFGIDDISVPVPLEDFKITPNADLLVIDTTRSVLEAAPRVTPFSADGIDLQSQKVNAYWKAHLSNKGVNRPND